MKHLQLFEEYEKSQQDIFDWIDDYATIATKEQLIQQRDELIKNEKDVENFQYKLNKLNNYIDKKLN